MFTDILVLSRALNVKLMSSKVASPKRLHKYLSIICDASMIYWNRKNSDQ